MLVELLAAARLMDEIFLRQVWEGSPEMRQRLETEADEATREYFRVNFGPWDRLAELEPFIGDMPHPEGAGFYPVDMTREEFNRLDRGQPRPGRGLQVAPYRNPTTR